MTDQRETTPRRAPFGPPAARGRRPAILSALALLVAGLLADHVIGRPTAALAGASVPAMPSQAPAGALSSTWFCPATTATPNGPADGRIVIADPAPSPITGSVTFIPSQGSSVTQSVNVEPRSRLVLRPGDTTPAPFAAAVVQLDGPDGVVDEQIRGGLGESVAPCATKASDGWFFASGTTDEGAQLLVSLLNPYPGDAVVDFDFATELGPSTPADLQGIVVPGHGLTVINVGDHVRRRDAVATAVRVRAGRVVADKIELLMGAAGPNPSPRGAILTLGAPAPALTWYYPDGIAAPGAQERYEVFNPGDAEARVQVALTLAAGTADPFDLVVAPHDRAELIVNGQSRIPPGVAHAGTVQSVNGVPIVAERRIAYGPPSERSGISDLIGASRASSHWLFAAGAANAAQDEWLVAFNPGASPTHLTVTALLSGDAMTVDSLGDVLVPPGQRVALRLNDHLSRGDLVVNVDADTPVVIERDLFRIKGLGASASLGVPAPL
jgi:hypothetical protein